MRRLGELGASQWVVIVDAAGWHPGLFDKTAFRVLRSMAALDADHYPERLGRLIVVNAPRLLAFAWRAPRPATRRASRRAVPPHLTRHLHQARDPLVARRPSACEGGYHL